MSERYEESTEPIQDIVDADVTLAEDQLDVRQQMERVASATSPWTVKHDGPRVWKR